MFSSNVKFITRTFYDTTDNTSDCLIFIGVALSSGIIAVFISKLFKNIIVPYTLIISILGILFGLVGKYVERTIHYFDILDLHPRYFLVAFLPQLTFYSAFCIEYSIFKRSWSQILTISSLGIAVHTVLVGLFIKTLKEIPLTFSLFYGLLTSPTCCLEVVNYLAVVGQNKHLCVLLESESAFSFAASLILHQMLIRILLKDNWHTLLITMAVHFFGGLAVGIIFGKITCLFIKLTYERPITAFTFSMSTSFITYYICSELLNLSAVLAVFVIGVMVCRIRSELPTNLDEFLDEFWSHLNHITIVLICFMLGATLSIEILHESSCYDFVQMLLVYIVVNIARFVSFGVIFPILKNTGYGFSWPKLIVCVWGGLRNEQAAFCISIVTIGDSNLTKAGKDLIFLTTCLQLLTLVVNGITLPLVTKKVGLTKYPRATELSMDFCFKYILQEREKKVAVLKMNQSLAEVNWQFVYRETILAHPYRKNFMDECPEEEAYKAFHLIQCPLCLKEVPRKITKSEKNEIVLESRLRILKARKVSLLRQFENGMLTKEGISILMHHLNVAMDSNNKQINQTKLLKLFQMKGITFVIYHKLQKLLLKFEFEKRILPPRKPFRRIFYKIIISNKFITFYTYLVFVHVMLLIFELFTTFQTESYLLILSYTINLSFFILYLAEFVMKVLGLSWVYIYKDGLKTYFRSFWNIMDFCILCMIFFEVMVLSIQFYSNSIQLAIYSTKFSVYALRAFKLLRLLLLLRLFRSCLRTLKNWYKSRFYNKLTFAYDLAKAYITTTEDVTEQLDMTIERDEIRKEIKETLEAHKIEVEKAMGIIAKDHPWIPITVTTKNVMRYILNCTKNEIHDLKELGWLDELETLLMLNSLEERFTFLNSIFMIQPYDPSVMMEEIAWIGSGNEILAYFNKRVRYRHFNVGKDFILPGQLIDGVYIVVTGMLQLIYKPSEGTTSRLKAMGLLPVLDNMGSTNLHFDYNSFITSGSTLGEMSILTNRGYDCTIKVVKQCHMYFLSKECLKEAFEIFNDKINGLEQKIWKIIIRNIVISVLQTIPVYRYKSSDYLKQLYNKAAIVPNLKECKAFLINDNIETVVLVQGIIYDQYDKYVAPIYIPSQCRRLLLEEDQQTIVAFFLAPDIVNYKIVNFGNGIWELIISSNYEKPYMSVVSSGSTLVKTKMRRRFINTIGATFRSSKVSDSSKFDEGGSEAVAAYSLEKKETVVAFALK